MEKSSVSLKNLLDQLSEEKINLVVDSNALRALGSPGGCEGTTSNSNHCGTCSSTANNSRNSCPPPTTVSVGIGVQLRLC
jgi:hypothetical protein